MFIPFVIPASVRTHKKWVIETMETPLLGGYLIMGVALIPPFITAFILSWFMSQPLTTLGENFWLVTFFITGILIFFWDKWLHNSYETEIKIIYTPVEYYSYLIIISSLIYLYA